MDERTDSINIVIAQGYPKQEMYVDRYKIEGEEVNMMVGIEFLKKLWEHGAGITQGLPFADIEPEAGDWVVLVDPAGHDWNIGIRCTNTNLYCKHNFIIEKEVPSFIVPIVSLLQNITTCPACGFVASNAAAGRHMGAHVQKGELEYVNNSPMYFSDRKRPTYRIPEKKNAKKN